MIFVFHLSPYPPEELITDMWLPRWTKKIVEAVQKESDAIQESLTKQVSAIKNTSQAWEEKQREVGSTVAASIKAASDAATNYEKPQRDKEHRLQWGMFVVTLAGTIFAAAAAAGAWYYAHIAVRQACIMQQTYTEIQKQTKAAECAARGTESAANTASDTLKFNRDSFREDQRPYIALPGQFVGGQGVGVHEGRLRAMIPIQNYGKSPATQVRYFARIAVGDDQIRRIDFSRSASDDYGIAPLGLQPPIAAYSAKLSAEDMTKAPEVIAASNRIIVYGRIDYTDMFPTPKPSYALYFCQEAFAAGSEHSVKTPKECTGKNYIQ